MRERRAENQDGCRCQPEKTLHLCALLNGVVGSGMSVALAPSLSQDDTRIRALEVRNGNFRGARAGSVTQQMRVA
jgi:hypothetical protein